MAVNNAKLKDRLLADYLSRLDRAVVALSGGVDSTYLLYKAVEALGPENVLAVTVNSELTAKREIEAARAAAIQVGALHRVLDVQLLDVSEIAENGRERCYICKKHIYEKILALDECSARTSLLDGSNADDQKETRPGMRAVKELGILTPMLEVGLSKKEVRFLAKENGLLCWDRPSSPCLASRLPYGERITPAKLLIVSAAERYLQQLGVRGDLRVRCHGSLARIEVNEAYLELLLEKRGQILEEFKKMGFVHVTIDLGGFHSGSMDLEPGD